MSYTRHQLSASWPDMQPEEFQALKDSIDVNGLRESIVLFDGMILDGWHRYKACQDTGMEPAFVDLDESEDPLEYVKDKHTNRALTMVQRMTAFALMHASWSPRGRPFKSALSADLNHLVTSRPALSAQLTSAQLAKDAGGGIRTAEQVKEVVAKGSDALIDGLKSGQVSAAKAAAIAKLPKAEQAEALTKPLPKKPAKFVQPPAPIEPPHPDAEGYTELDAAHDQISGLQDALAVACMGEVSEEDKANAQALIADMRKQIKTLNATLQAVTTSRDAYMHENVELRRQITRQRKEVDRATGRRTA